MFKRTWIVIVGALALGVLLSACGGGDLAEDLTPIPTLPQGEEPELVEALQVTAEPAAVASAAELSDEELVALGEATFAQCAGCHGPADGAGPALPGMGARAASRVEGMSAADYLHEAIVDPGAYVVEGFGNIMPADYSESLSAQEIDGLVAYILAETGEADAADEPAADDADAADADAAGEEPADEEPADDQAAEDEQPADEDAAEAPSEDASEGEGETEDATSAEDAEAEAAVAGDATNGEALFASACAACHGPEAGAGPSLPSMTANAADRVDGMSAAEYLHESIVDPGAFLVDGFANIMPPTYSEQFSEQELQDLVAYILGQ